MKRLGGRIIPMGVFPANIIAIITVADYQDKNQFRYRYTLTGRI